MKNLNWLIAGGIFMVLGVANWSDTPAFRHFISLSMICFGVLVILNRIDEVKK